jgi:hypothetical protein
VLRAIAIVLNEYGYSHTELVRAEFDYRTQSLRYRLVQMKVRTPPEAIPKRRVTGPFAMCLRTPRRQWGYDERVDGRFARRTDFAGFSGASVDDGASTTRGDENVRTPCESKSITVWYSFTLLRVPCPYCVCVTRSPGAYLSMSSPT